MVPPCCLMVSNTPDSDDFFWHRSAMAVLFAGVPAAAAFAATAIAMHAIHVCFFMSNPKTASRSQAHAAGGRNTPAGSTAIAPICSQVIETKRRQDDGTPRSHARPQKCRAERQNPSTKGCWGFGG